MTYANQNSAKLYEIGAGTSEIRRMVIGRVSETPSMFGLSELRLTVTGVQQRVQQLRFIGTSWDALAKAQQELK